MKIRTEDLNPEDGTLDWAVAKCEGGSDFWFDTVAAWWTMIDGKDRTLSKGWGHHAFNPSTNWTHGGPIIDREIRNGLHFWQEDSGQFAATYNYGGDDPYTYASTPLAAAMRCFVSTKLGPEVEMPDALVRHLRKMSDRQKPASENQHIERPRA